VLNLLYVGQIIDAKGVGDAIEAVARLKAQGRAARLDIIGSGNTGTFKAQADALGLSQNVCFQGLRSHAEVLEAMRSADIVVVPSRHSYPEGLPMTLYEAMCMRTPLAVSDHPMFRLRIRDGQNAVVFSESDPSSMADALHRLGSDKALYETISRNHANAASEYLCPLKWHDLIRSFLNPESGSDLQQHSLAAAG
jgi:glycosyltransferase involved in cell wall biosynthesis